MKESLNYLGFVVMPSSFLFSVLKRIGDNRIGPLVIFDLLCRGLEDVQCAQRCGLRFLDRLPVMLAYHIAKYQ